MKAFYIAAVMAVGSVLNGPLSAKADDNIGDARRSVEEKGGKVYYGKHFDHAEYLKAAIVIGSGGGAAYAADLATDIAKTTGQQIAADVLGRLLKGETVSINGREIQGGIVAYNHWRVTKHHFFDGWPPRWQEITNTIPLPNTHQLYIRIK